MLLVIVGSRLSICIMSSTRAVHILFGLLFPRRIYKPMLVRVFFTCNKKGKRSITWIKWNDNSKRNGPIYRNQKAEES
ncbi:hypothetical protein BX666DRAFT_771864 [Dichotomocladium elegans]|nr:hypothetical protein BX666DRAFT_771864 [Dichotomocladium elegans]